MENPIKMDDDWGYPYLWKPPYVYLYICVCITIYLISFIFLTKLKLSRLQVLRDHNCGNIFVMFHEEKTYSD